MYSSVHQGTAICVQIVSLAGVVLIVHMDAMNSTRVIRGSLGLIEPTV